jgi:hypothetical protein
MRAVREGDLWLGLRGQVYRALLEAAPPAYGDLIARETDDRARAIVEPIRSASTELIRLYRVCYRTGEEMGCRATYWIQCWGTDFALAKYDDYWLRHDHVGYRRIGEVQEVIQLANGVHLPSRTVTWRLKYLPDEERAWHSTTVAILLDAAIHDGTKPQIAVWGWLPLGTYISDPAHRAPGHHNPHYLAGNVDELRRLVFSRFAVAPPFEPRMDAPPDETAIRLHAGPPELEVELPSVRGEPYDWGPSAKGATR